MSPYHTGDGKVTHRWAQLLPGGGGSMFTRHARELLERIWRGSHCDCARKVCSGALLWAVSSQWSIWSTFGGTRYAAPFDLDRLELTRSPVPFWRRTTRATACQFAVSDNGTWVYLRAKTAARTYPRVVGSQANHAIAYDPADGAICVASGVCARLGHFRRQPDGCVDV